MLRTRLAIFTAIGLIGDGVVALIAPSCQSRFWAFGPPSWRTAMENFAERPQVTRALAAAQIAIGLALVFNEYSDR